MASKYRRNKVKFKWTKELGFLLLAILIISGVTIGLAIPTKAERNLATINEKIEAYNTENETTYGTLPQDNRVRVLSHEEVISKKNNNDSMIIWYGSLTSGPYLQVISALNDLADLYEVDTVYLYYSTFVTEATDNDETSTLKYKEDKQKMENELNDKAEFEKLVDLETGNALLVYKEGKLVFNSQVGESTIAYSANNYLLKAFSILK